MLIKNSSQVNKPLEIFNLLKKIQKSNQLIALSFESLPQYCLTLLLEVHHDSQALIFDEPNPQLSSKLTSKRNKAKFSLKLNYLPITFETKITKNNNGLHADFPKKIHYPQNRKYYRFNTEYIENINTAVFLSSKTRLPCELLDVSLEGICLRFPYSYARLFQANRLIDDIYIELPNQNGFSISAKVQNTRIVKNYAYIAVGLQIQQKKQNVEKIIQQFIFRTESA